MKSTAHTVWAGLLAVILTFVSPSPVEAAQRTRGFCYLSAFGIGDLHREDCGRAGQVNCNSGAHCDSGYRPVYFSDAGQSNLTVSCGGLPNETVSGACVSCGGEGEIACLSNQCDGGLGFVTTTGLNGPISICTEFLPADPPDVSIVVPKKTILGITYFAGATYNIAFPSAASFVEAYGTCSDGFPVSLSGASRENWPSAEPASGGNGTAVFIHGRGSKCSNMTPLLQAAGGGIFERNHRTYCVEYDQAASPQRVNVFEPVEQASGVGPLPCAVNGTCSFDFAHPIYTVDASSYTLPGVASAVARAIQAIPTQGEISLLAHSQGGFVMRALLHEHYDDLRWTGNKISRVATLGHPYYGMVVDPSLATSWFCIDDSTFDCSVLEWLWGWQNWLGSTTGSIDNDDFPQIEWTAVGGDGGAIVPGALDSGPSASDECQEIFGGGWAPNIAGDGGVSTASSLGIDELGFFAPVTSLAFDASPLVNCDHSSDCLLREALALDPEMVPIASPPGLPIPGALAFDGVDDEIGGLSGPQIGAMTVTGELTLEAWIRPSVSTQTTTILSKEGEYGLALVEGEFEWALANTFPGWGWIQSGFTPPVNEWSHVALVYDPVGSATVYVNGVEFMNRADFGPIGDADALDDFRIGGGENPSNGRFEGRLDDVRVWKRALQKNELLPVLASLVDASDPDLLGWWVFDEGTGDTLLDLSSKGHHLSLAAYGASAVPNRLAADRLREGGTVYFDGVNDFLRVTDPVYLSELEMDGALTIEAWLNPRGPGGGGGGVILNKEGEYALTRMTDGTIAFSLANTNPGWVTVLTSATAPEHTWTHIAVAYQDGTPGSIEIYENGVLVDSIPADGLIGDFTTVQNELRIGGRQSVGNNQWFHGLLDEVRLWNVQRTPAQIAQYHDQALYGPIQSGLQGYWRFDQRTGELVSDSSGASHHASLGMTDGLNTPIRSHGPALPDYPMGILPVPEPGLLMQVSIGAACLIGFARRRVLHFNQTRLSSGPRGRSLLTAA
jgi:hypothetical protein